VMEDNVEEAVGNNIFGLLTLLNVAQSSQCGAFVMISSDKAVNPTNVMGCTKRVGELILAAWPGERMRCVSVRFGNVLGSNGSVIPLFQEQIRQNQPITITHPEITRFFMTIAEAVSLVLQAFAVGRKGDILVLDMGEPVRVTELAKTLARLSGKPGQEFEFIGLRPGGKLFEELFYPDERVLPSACAKIACTESAKLAWPVLKRGLDELYVAVSLGERTTILAQLRRIVPQFIYADCETAVSTAMLSPSSETKLSPTRSPISSAAQPETPALTEAQRSPYRTWPANPQVGPQASPLSGPMSGPMSGPTFEPTGGGPGD
jgi:FlaA1/EpsC-like NDP-sugar epimerase